VNRNENRSREFELGELLGLSLSGLLGDGVGPAEPYTALHGERSSDQG